MKAYFYLKRNTLYCRFSDGKAQKVLSTGIKLSKEQFDVKLQYAKKSRKANIKIDHWQQLAEKFTIDTIAQGVKSDKEVILLSELVTLYIESKRDLASSTIEKYIGFATILQKYCPQYNYPIDALSKTSILCIYNEFRTKMSINSAYKRMSQLNGFLNFATNFDYINKNPMNGLEFKKERKAIVYLSKSEVERLSNAVVDSHLTDILEVVCDLFVFAIETAMEYKRLANLKESDIHKDEHGNSWAYTFRPKTGRAANVILSDKALEILNKYKGTNSPFCFYVPANATMNRYLKVLAPLCGINKKLHTHIARHTFATTKCLLVGVSSEVTAKMMGISVAMLLDTYGEIVDERVRREMQRVKEIGM